MCLKQYFLFAIFLYAFVTAIGQQTFERTWDGNQINVLVVANINGSIALTGHNKSVIAMEGTKKITGSDSDLIDVAYKQISDTLTIYIKSPCHSFLRSSTQSKNNSGTFHYQWNEANRCKDADYHIDFSLHIPEDLIIFASTINAGDISIKNCSGAIWANNINGSLDLDGVSKVHHAKTINGDLTLTFKTHPDLAGTFYTLNGDIHALFDPGLNANVSFKSFNGDFYTNVESVEILPNTMEKEETSQGIKYKIGESTKMRLGNGGVHLDFETFNGDAILKFKS